MSSAVDNAQMEGDMEEMDQDMDQMDGAEQLEEGVEEEDEDDKDAGADYVKKEFVARPYKSEF